MYLRLGCTVVTRKRFCFPLKIQVDRIVVGTYFVGENTLCEINNFMFNKRVIIATATFARIEVLCKYLSMC